MLHNFFGSLASLFHFERSDFPGLTSSSWLHQCSLQPRRCLCRGSRRNLSSRFLFSASCSKERKLLPSTYRRWRRSGDLTELGTQRHEKVSAQQKRAFLQPSLEPRALHMPYTGSITGLCLCLRLHLSSAHDTGIYCNSSSPSRRGPVTLTCSVSHGLILPFLVQGVICNRVTGLEGQCSFSLACNL